MNVLGMGSDIVECLRIAQMIDRHGDIFINRVYTPYEIGYCQARKAATQHYAGRWAAKEAVLKALGVGWSRGIVWTDIEVRPDAGGQSCVALGGLAREACEELGVSQLILSIAHCRHYATAHVIALGAND